MSTVLITYDIQRTTATIHTEVKNAMIVKGYSEKVPVQGGTTLQLPNTTLVKDNITPDTAASDLKSVCQAKGAVLEKYIALEISYVNGRAEVLK